MMKEKVIKKIVFTWKSEQQKKDNNVYTFYVDPSANKFQIKSALEELFGVKVDKVGVARKKPVLRNSKKNVYTKLRKKIFAKLKPGYRIGDVIPENSSSLEKPLEGNDKE